MRGGWRETERRWRGRRSKKGWRERGGGGGGTEGGRGEAEGGRRGSGGRTEGGRREDGGGTEGILHCVYVSLFFQENQRTMYYYHLNDLYVS